MARKSTKIVAISNIQKQELCEKFKVAPCEKFEVVPLGFDLERFQINHPERRRAFRAKYGLNQEDLVIGIIGRLVPIKNHHLLIQAFAEVKAKTQKTLKLIIIGDGEIRDELQRFSSSQNLNISNSTAVKSDVVFTSWITDIESALPGLDIVALSSFNEGTPVSLIEAQAANVPVISTRVGGIEDIVLEGETAVLSENNNLEEFSTKLLDLVEDDSLRRRMKIKGFKHVYERYSYTTLCSNMSTLYASLNQERAIKAKN